MVGCICPKHGIVQLHHQFLPQSLILSISISSLSSPLGWADHWPDRTSHSCCLCCPLRAAPGSGTPCRLRPGPCMLLWVLPLDCHIPSGVCSGRNFYLTGQCTLALLARVMTTEITAWAGSASASFLLTLPVQTAMLCPGWYTMLCLPHSWSLELLGVAYLCVGVGALSAGPAHTESELHLFLL